MIDDLKTYLFIIDQEEASESYIAVKQAYINKHIAIKTERIGKYGIIFTSEKSNKEVIDQLKMKDGERFLLIELTGSITAEAIVGFFPDTDIDELRCLNLENLKDSAEWLQKELEKALEKEDYKTAAEIRDKINSKSEEE